MLQANVHAMQDMAELASAGPEAQLHASVKTSGERCLLNLAALLLLTPTPTPTLTPNLTLTVTLTLPYP